MDRGGNTELPASACQGKLPYDSFRDAHKSINRMRRRNRKFNDSTRGLQPYKCPVCHLFHVGHDKVRDKDKFSRR